MKKARILALALVMAMIFVLSVMAVQSTDDLTENNHLFEERGFSVNVDGNMTYGKYSEDNIQIELIIEKFEEEYLPRTEYYENVDVQIEYGSIEYYDSGICEHPIPLDIRESYSAKMMNLLELMNE